jgi:hypothetical protein
LSINSKIDYMGSETKVGNIDTNNASTNLIPAKQFVIQGITSPYPISADPVYLNGFVFDALDNGNITFGVNKLKPIYVYNNIYDYLRAEGFDNRKEKLSFGERVYK